MLKNVSLCVRSHNRYIATYARITDGDVNNEHAAGRPTCVIAVTGLCVWQVQPFRSTIPFYRLSSSSSLKTENKYGSTNPFLSAGGRYIQNHPLHQKLIRACSAREKTETAKPTAELQGGRTNYQQKTHPRFRRHSGRRGHFHFSPILAGNRP